MSPNEQSRTRRIGVIVGASAAGVALLVGAGAAGAAIQGAVSHPQGRPAQVGGITSDAQGQVPGKPGQGKGQGQGHGHRQGGQQPGGQMPGGQMPGDQLGQPGTQPDQQVPPMAPQGNKMQGGQLPGGQSFMPGPQGMTGGSN